MDKDNEIYVTSNGELYKKDVEQAIYPQTNYTTQQFYTKEEYDKLQAENEQLKKLKFKSDGIELLQDANLNLHNANVKYRQALQEIREIAVNEYYAVDDDARYITDKILAKINEVGAEE